MYVVCMNSVQELDHALKQVQSKAPDTAVLFLSPDPDKNQVLCLAQVPEVLISTCMLRAATVKDSHDVSVNVLFYENFLQEYK